MKLSLVSRQLLSKLLVCVLCTSGTGVFCQSFSPPTDEICPGGDVTFTCVAVDDDGTRSTRWTVTPGGGDDTCFVPHMDPVPDSCGPSNSFTASFTGRSGDQYSSTLSVAAISDSLNGTTVQCTDPTGSINGSDNICIVGGFDPPQFMNRSFSKVHNCTDEDEECTRNMTATWSKPVISCGGSVSRCECCVTPPTPDYPSGPGSGSGSGDNECICTDTGIQVNLTVIIGQTYNLTARAESCKMGNNSSVEEIIVKGCDIRMLRVSMDICNWTQIDGGYTCEIKGVNETERGASVIYDGISEVATYTTTGDYLVDGEETFQTTCQDNIWDKLPNITKAPNGTEDMPAPTTETDGKQLKSSDIGLIAAGVVLLVIGIIIAAVLGGILLEWASNRLGGGLAIAAIAVSVLALPVAIIACRIAKKKENGVVLKLLYKLLLVASMVLTVVSICLWIAVLIYATAAEFDDGTRNLIIASFVFSFIVVVEWVVSAILWKWGVKYENEESDGAPPKPRRSNKKEEAEQELETYETLQHVHKQPSSPQPLLSAGDPTYGRLNAQQQQEEEEQQYDHVQREKKKAVPNVNDPNYSHFASGGAGGQHYGKLDHGTGTGKGGTLPGSVPPATDEYGKLDKNRGGSEEYAVVTNEPRHKPKKTGH